MFVDGNGGKGWDKMDNNFFFFASTICSFGSGDVYHICTSACVTFSFISVQTYNMLRWTRDFSFSYSFNFHLACGINLLKTQKKGIKRANVLSVDNFGVYKEEFKNSLLYNIIILNMLRLCFLIPLSHIRCLVYLNLLYIFSCSRSFSRGRYTMERIRS